jgi:hypothetical protein
MRVHYFFLVLFSLCACGKFNYTADENSKQHINSYSEMEQAVTGAYAKFASLFADDYLRNSYLFQGMFADDYDFFNTSGCKAGTCSDYGFKTLDEKGDTVYLASGAIRAFYKSDLNYNVTLSEFMNKSYKDFYKAIISQNYILCQFKDQASSNDSLNSLLGEIYYLRAYTYYRFTRFFGMVPLITDLEVDYRVKRATFREIYDQIESDLLQAIQLLPESTLSARNPYITPCQGSAIALLSEVYLTMGGYPLHDINKYTLSAKYAKEVIENASEYGFGLVDDFADLHKLKSGVNHEMVSVVYYSAVYNPNLFKPGYQVSFPTNELSAFYRNALTEVQFFNNFPEGYRKDCTYSRAHEIYRWDTTKKEFISGTANPIKTTSNYRIELKNSTLFDSEYYQGKEDFYIYILRYAHTLLAYAEASARAGNIDAMSYEAINQVRRRANKLPINTPSKFDLLEGLTANEFIDSVVWERAWEFTGEAEGRWFDLLRLEMVGRLNELRDPHEAPPLYDGILKGEYFFPIPEDDIFLNPNLANN